MTNHKTMLVLSYGVVMTEPCISRSRISGRGANFLPKSV